MPGLMLLSHENLPVVWCWRVKRFLDCGLKIRLKLQFYEHNCMASLVSNSNPQRWKNGYSLKTILGSLHIFLWLPTPVHKTVTLFLFCGYNKIVPDMSRQTSGGTQNFQNYEFLLINYLKKEEMTQHIQTRILFYIFFSNFWKEPAHSVNGRVM